MVDLTVEAMTQVQNLINNRTNIERILHMLGDGNWKQQLKLHEEHMKTTLLGHFACKQRPVHLIVTPFPL